MTFALQLPVVAPSPPAAASAAWRHLSNLSSPSWIAARVGFLCLSSVVVSSNKPGPRGATARSYGRDGHRALCVPTKSSASGFRTPDRRRRQRKIETICVKAMPWPAPAREGREAARADNFHGYRKCARDVVAAVAPANDSVWWPGDVMAIIEKPVRTRFHRKKPSTPCLPAFHNCIA
ncbi:uncharacterized protein LOC144105610 [Amblyomma americanum]